ncbi:peptidoglycan-binding protein [Streptomyces sp. NPDC051940]|uniref:peptidoglycan-binding protein n=1 Tax=Streptomyces sp. NPDC051940 TaxID=3155675 RepID=UPI00341B141A
MNDQACPECGAPRNAYGTPGCGCAIGSAREGAAQEATAADPSTARPVPGQPVPGQPVPGQPVPGQPVPGQQPAQPTADGPAPDAEGAADAAPRREPQLIRPYVMQSTDRPVRAPEETQRLPLPRQAFLPSSPAPEDVDMFEGEGPAEAAPAPDDTTELDAIPAGPPTSPRRQARRERNRRPLVIAAAAASVLVVAGVAAALAGSGSSEEDAGPDRPVATASANPSPTEAPASEPASPSPSKSASPSPSKSPSESASPSPSPSKSTKAPAPTGPTLSRGSSGSEVEELQGRLKELGLYAGPIDGSYDVQVVKAVSNYQDDYGVTGDASGVYGPNTRRSLESRT